MNSRNTSFDGIRAIAILGIIFCHICYGLPGMSWLGIYLGGTFNCVFFSLSALLFGKRMLMEGGEIIPFMIPRLHKIAASLWPMLVVALTIFLIGGVPFSFKAAIANFCLLGWFAKLPGMGHLWFVTMIVLCYILFVMLSNIKREVSIYLIIPAFIITGICAAILSHLGMPGYLFLILFYCSLLFLYGKKMLKWASSVSYLLLFGITWIINGFTIAAFYIGLLHHGGLSMYYVTAVGGISMILWLYRTFKIYKPGGYLLFLSGISYELYLVHHPFCFGDFSLFQLTGNNWGLGVLFILLLSILLAVGLKRIAGILYHR